MSYFEQRERLVDFAALLLLLGAGIFFSMGGNFKYTVGFMVFGFLAVAGLLYLGWGIRTKLERENPRLLRTIQVGAIIVFFILFVCWVFDWSLAFPTIALPTFALASQPTGQNTLVDLIDLKTKPEAYVGKNISVRSTLAIFEVSAYNNNEYWGAFISDEQGSQQLVRAIKANNKIAPFIIAQEAAKSNPINVSMKFNGTVIAVPVTNTNGYATDYRFVAYDWMLTK